MSGPHSINNGVTSSVSRPDGFRSSGLVPPRNSPAKGIGRATNAPTHATTPRPVEPSFTGLQKFCVHQNPIQPGVRIYEKYKAIAPLEDQKDIKAVEAILSKKDSVEKLMRNKKNCQATLIVPIGLTKRN